MKSGNESTRTPFPWSTGGESGRKRYFIVLQIPCGQTDYALELLERLIVILAEPLTPTAVTISISKNHRLPTPLT